MAPTPSSDVFALGIILQQICSWKTVQYCLVRSTADCDMNELGAGAKKRDVVVTQKQLDGLISLANRCNSINITERPDMASVRKEYRTITGIKMQ